MPVFRKPTFDYDYDVRRELRALREYPSRPDRADRAIPQKRRDRLLIATWNIANLGAQDRRDKDHALIAEMLGWFDLVAIQEVRDNLAGLRGVLEHLPRRYRTLFSDPGGNHERFVFVYDSRRLTPVEEIGEVTVPYADLRKVRLPGIERSFGGFDRNPYLAAFRAGSLQLVLANVHLYFGSSHGNGSAGGRHDGIERRCLEAYAVARWADIRRHSPYSYTPEVLALGDFNLPKREPGDPVFEALTRRGLEVPEHSTKVGGSNLNDDAHYDQMALFRGELRDRFLAAGIFDFDGALFADLWGPRREDQNRFRAYMRYYVSDHRPLWAQFAL